MRTVCSTQEPTTVYSRGFSLALWLDMCSDKKGTEPSRFGLRLITPTK